MPTYSYACDRCGGFDLLRPMAEADARTSCPGCGTPARRLVTAPALRALDPGLRSALDRQHRSADAPEVVGTVPGRPRRTQRAATDPRQARLPRP
jgi:putative FmdB family regulatory protein